MKYLILAIAILGFGCSSPAPVVEAKPQPKPDLEKLSRGDVLIHRLDSLKPFNSVVFRTDQNQTYIIYALSAKKKYKVTAEFIRRLGDAVAAVARGYQTAQIIIPVQSFDELNNPSDDLNILYRELKSSPSQIYFVEGAVIKPLLPKGWPVGNNSEITPPNMKHKD